MCKDENENEVEYRYMDVAVIEIWMSDRNRQLKGMQEIIGDFLDENPKIEIISTDFSQSTIHGDDFVQTYIILFYRYPDRED